MTLITCNNVTLSYEGVNVVTDLSFNVDQGDYLCIVGENGSGKSTLMKALLGLKSPSAGNIEFSKVLHRSDIGYLPQQTGIQRDFPASVFEVVISGMVAKEKSFFYSKKSKLYAQQIMKKIGISDIAGKSYRELSGGQQQRALLARAVCASDKLIVLDEPVAGLDPHITSQLYELITDLNRSGITVIMVSHDILTATQYASHILHLGKTPKFFGTKDDYLKSDIGKFYLNYQNQGEGINA